LDESLASGFDVKVFFIGKKVRDLLATSTYNKGKTFTHLLKHEPTFVEMENVANELWGAFHDR
jgi:F0F1-type ATP synthase gamma subunit